MLLISLNLSTKLSQGCHKVVARLSQHCHGYYNFIDGLTSEGNQLLCYKHAYS